MDGRMADLSWGLQEMMLIDGENEGVSLVLRIFDFSGMGKRKTDVVTATDFSHTHPSSTIDNFFVKAVDLVADVIKLVGCRLSVSPDSPLCSTKVPLSVAKRTMTEEQQCQVVTPATASVELPTRLVTTSIVASADQTSVGADVSCSTSTLKSPSTLHAAKGSKKATPAKIRKLKCYSKAFN
ncbi:hypothetical protein NDU88_004933 [Pleurodeles waltl]|uniref:Uncharacterized protein n=1 Tax=Pleurodeles waltl TaxID=8319 RepID=A0AAV7TU74_PLEWA|nr:hypothetical protein NDU88_004933 [Pleurodeles waltl]